MRSCFRPYMLCVLPLLAACAPQYTETRVAQDGAIPSAQARFASDPTEMRDALEAACISSGATFNALGVGGGRCVSLPSPEAAAALVLRYDGALEAPQIIVEHSIREDADSFVVSIAHFASIPKRDGGEQRVYLQSRALDRSVERLFRSYGGEPI